ncbi:MAG TPA: 4Fe-4S single cluster domain-containing protein [Anaerolineaceae bacterium]|nr:4Fe-4S single cluster domain-containing protein [Anaerolineaceae bacterium]
MPRSPLQLQLHHLETHSRANGPGLRAVVWVQGCTLGCPGCFNPATHSRRGGTRVAVAELAARLLAIPDVTGVTISGGEPLQQLPAVGALVQQLRRQSGLTLILFTGYSWTEVTTRPGTAALLDQLDVLISGRYLAGSDPAHGLRGSSNQEIHFLTSRYGAGDFATVPEAEIILSAEGDIRLTGIAPLKW